VERPGEYGTGSLQNGQIVVKKIASDFGNSMLAKHIFENPPDARCYWPAPGKPYSPLDHRADSNGPEPSPLRE